MTLTITDPQDPHHVSDFVEELQDGQKLNPVILVKTPGNDKLEFVDGHHRFPRVQAVEHAS